MTKKNFTIEELEEKIKLLEQENNELKIISKENFRRYNILFDQKAAGVILVNPQGKLHKVNQAYCDITGYAEDELIGKHFKSITHPDDMTIGDFEFDQLKKGIINNFTIEKRYIQKNGNIVWVNINVSPTWEFSETPNFAISIILDISERKHAEIKVQNSEKKYKNLVENLNIGYFISSAEGKFIFVNDAVVKIAGFDSVEDFLQLPAQKLYADAGDRECIIQSLQQTGTVKNKVVRSVKKDGSTYWISLNMVMLRDSKNKPDQLIGFIEDVSEKIKTENEILKAKEKAEESDRLKSSFLANMSHEIRTPMNAIMGFSELLEDDDLPAEKRQSFIKTIRSRSLDLLNIINDILDISKIESGGLKLYPVNGFIHIMLEELLAYYNTKNNDLFNKPIQFIVVNNLSIEQNMVYCDFARLKQILNNLIENAFKFTKSGTIEIGCNKDNDTLIFYVKDTGIGIPKEKQTIIFDRFRQADELLESRKFGGSGLGLSISKGLIELMNGTIWLESEKNMGSVFYFKIPYVVSGSNLPSESVKSKINYNWRGKTILIVDDTPYNVQYLSLILHDSSANLLFADTAKSAIKIFCENPSINLVLMDIRLPDGNGFELTKMFLSVKKNVLIIAQTAYASDDDKNESLKAGCIDYISKPITKDHLLKMINRQFSR